MDLIVLEGIHGNAKLLMLLLLLGTERWWRSILLLLMAMQIIYGMLNVCLWFNHMVINTTSRVLLFN